jgi:hypothetical protein
MHRGSWARDATVSNTIVLLVTGAWQCLINYWAVGTCGRESALREFT